MSADVRTQAFGANPVPWKEPPAVAIQRSREAAQRLWVEIGRALAEPFAQSSAVGR